MLYKKNIQCQFFKYIKDNNDFEMLFTQLNNNIYNYKVIDDIKS